MRFQKSTTNLPSTKKLNGKVLAEKPYTRKSSNQKGSIYMNMLKVLNRFYVIILFACEPNSREKSLIYYLLKQKKRRGRWNVTVTRLLYRCANASRWVFIWARVESNMAKMQKKIEKLYCIKSHSSLISRKIKFTIHIQSYFALVTFFKTFQIKMKKKR